MAVAKDSKETKKTVIKVKFFTEVLGMRPNSQEIVKDYIASKAPDAKSKEEEIEAAGVDAVVENTMTIFPQTEDGRRYFFNHQWKGYMKEACSYLQRYKTGKESAKIKAFKKTIDGNVQIYSDSPTDFRKIFIELPEGGEIGSVQRSLRAQTAQGDRIALANSESLPAGSICKFLVECPDDILPAVLEWFDYGRKHGTGQWRNADYGLFTYEAFDYDSGEKIASSQPLDKIDLSNF